VLLEAWLPYCLALLCFGCGYLQLLRDATALQWLYLMLSSTFGSAYIHCLEVPFTLSPQQRVLKCATLLIMPPIACKLHIDWTLVCVHDSAQHLSACILLYCIAH
jgi:hypothetical protein